MTTEEWKGALIGQTLILSETAHAALRNALSQASLEYRIIDLVKGAVVVRPITEGREFGTPFSILRENKEMFSFKVIYEASTVPERQSRIKSYLAYMEHDEVRKLKNGLRKATVRKVFPLGRPPHLPVGYVNILIEGNNDERERSTRHTVEHAAWILAKKGFDAPQRGSKKEVMEARAKVFYGTTPKGDKRRVRPPRRKGSPAVRGGN